MIIGLSMLVCLCWSWSSFCTSGSVCADHDHQFVHQGLSLKILIIFTWGSVFADYNSSLQSLFYVYVVELCDRPCSFFMIEDLFLLGFDAVLLSVCRLCSSFQCKELGPRHNVTSLKNWIFWNCVVRTSNLLYSWCWRSVVASAWLWLVKLWWWYSILCRCWRLTWASGIKRSMIWWSWARRWQMRATLTQRASWMPVAAVRRSECVML